MKYCEIYSRSFEVYHIVESYCIYMYVFFTESYVNDSS